MMHGNSNLKCVLMCLAKSEEKTAIISYNVINWSW